jgi:hypothetical protein
VPVSKERAVRRAAREAEREQRVAEHARRDAAAARRRERKARWTRRFSWLPGVGATRTRWSRSTGPLAVKRRRIWGFVAVCFVVLQALTWVVTPSWGMRAAVLIVSIFALPLAAALSSG